MSQKLLQSSCECCLTGRLRDEGNESVKFLLCEESRHVSTGQKRVNCLKEDVFPELMVLQNQYDVFLIRDCVR